MIHKNEDNGKKLNQTARLEMFSDGVFAIAITLLSLELIAMVRIKDDTGLLQTYLHHWESFLAYLIGFTTILVCWINHHHIFDYINKVDGNLFWINGFVLLAITITPFSTAVLAEYLEQEGRTALAIFGFNYFIIAIASYCISAYTYKKHMIEEDSREFYHCIKTTYAFSIGYTFIALGVCFISILAAIVLYVILFSAFAFPKSFATRVFKIKNREKNKLNSKS